MDKVPIWENPMIRDIAKLVTGLVVVALMLLFVVRPLITYLTDTSRTIVGGLPPGAGGGAGEGQPGAAAIAAPAGPAGAIAYEQQIAQARGIVAKDPARVAQVVKEWVQNE
jgi:flagellar M-ring protein FliF